MDNDSVFMVSSEMWTDEEVRLALERRKEDKEEARKSLDEQEKHWADLRWQLKDLEERVKAAGIETGRRRRAFKEAKERFLRLDEWYTRWIWVRDFRKRALDTERTEAQRRAIALGIPSYLAGQISDDDMAALAGTTVARRSD